MQSRFASLLSAISICTLAQGLAWDRNIMYPRLTSQSRNQTYSLQDFYQGEDFFTEWTFFTAADPTNGNVKYVSLQDAQAQNLAYVQSNLTVLAVDSTSQVAAGGQRNSVRITSNKVYNGGLFILDAEAVPVGCGVWPAFWSFGPNWPNQGEIDIMEGVNGLTYNQMTLHTGANATCEADPSRALSGISNATNNEPPTNSSPTPSSSPPASKWPPISSVPPCSSQPSHTPSPTPSSRRSRLNRDSSNATLIQNNLTSIDPVFYGEVLTTNCQSGGTSNQGCGIHDPNPESFGPGFNAVGGGVFALLWDQTNGIRIWRFSRANIPQDITSQNPNPAGWGIPAAAWGSSTCDIASNFKNHNLVFDITICGDWAGAASVYSNSSCPGTCAAIVANATNFVDAQWKINYVSVYQ